MFNDWRPFLSIIWAMKNSIDLNPQLALTRWSDDFGSQGFSADADSTLQAAFRLLRYDDAWRPLASQVPEITGNGSASLVAMWEEAYGGPQAYGRPASASFPSYWPAGFDAWPYAGDVHTFAPMFFAGQVQTRPVTTPQASGIEFTITIQDKRSPLETYPQDVIRLPVGVEAPLSPHTRVYGTSDSVDNPCQMDFDLEDEHLPRSWYYLESELFGLYRPVPGANETTQPGRDSHRIHTGAPAAIFSQDGRVWWALAGEVEYGAAILWGTDRVRLFTTLYLKPGGSAYWKFVIWRQEADQPNQVLLAATQPDGFFDILNPLGFKPKGAPSGPILFGNYPRLRLQLDEIRKLRPGLVLLNFFYDHISSIANLYGTWTTYEGFTTNENELKDLIREIKATGAKVGFFGINVEQAETHRETDPDSFIMDAWGRRFHAWEPGNWVTDPGHQGAAERLARAEAEFAAYYGFDAIFCDRLDHMAVNANPRRIGDTPRLELVPSVRLGMIHFFRKRMEWQRRLNPGLYVGLNNTTRWAGVRYADFCLLEGGDDGTDPALPFLYQPAGIVNLKHFRCLFGGLPGLNLFQAFGDMPDPTAFLPPLEEAIRRSLVSGIEAEPYGDEMFVDRHSMFFIEGHDKAAPDEEKYTLLRSIHYYGGAEWRALWDKVAPGLEAARRLATPAVSVWSQPEKGRPGFRHLFCARAGRGGGIYAGLCNQSERSQEVDFVVGGQHFSGTIDTGKARVWWFAPSEEQVFSLTF